MKTIVVVAHEGFQPSVLFSIREFFHVANKTLLKKHEKKLFKVIAASLSGEPVHDHLHCIEESISYKISNIKKCDAVIFLGTIPSYEKALTKNILKESDKKWIQEQASKGVLIGSILSGIFLLAEAGVLDGQIFTICPSYKEEFIKNYPHLKPIDSEFPIRSNNFISCYTIACWLDIAVEVVKATLDKEDANILLKDLYILNENKKTTEEQNTRKKDKFLADLYKAIETADNLDINSKKLANILAMSERTLTRKTQLYIQRTPKQLIDEVRIKNSCQLLIQTDKNIKEIAYLTGYTSDSAFRRSFIKARGMSPKKYRSEKKTLIS